MNQNMYVSQENNIGSAQGYEAFFKKKSAWALGPMSQPEPDSYTKEWWLNNTYIVAHVL